MSKQNNAANIAFAGPHSNRSGASQASSKFMESISPICASTHQRCCIPLTTHTAMPISDSPIRRVSTPA